jgi:hypothetical protein
MSMTRRSIKDISVTGIALGATSDIAATNLLLVPVAIVFFVRLAQSSLTPAERTAAFTRAISDDPRLYLLGMVLGGAASVFGGWVAARMARRAELMNGALSAIACVGFGIYGMATRADTVPLWQHFTFLVLSPALGALGGAIRQRQHAGLTPGASPSIEPSSERPPVELQGLGFAVYVGNRVLAGIGVLFVLFFGLIGVYGYSEHNSTVILGSVLFCVIALFVVVLLQIGARLLRAGRRAHWAYHGGALAVASMVVALFIVTTVARHHAG